MVTNWQIHSDWTLGSHAHARPRVATEIEYADQLSIACELPQTIEAHGVANRNPEPLERKKEKDAGEATHRSPESMTVLGFSENVISIVKYK